MAGEAQIPLGEGSGKGGQLNKVSILCNHDHIYHPHREGEYSVSVRYPNGSGKPVRHFKLVA